MPVLDRLMAIFAREAPTQTVKKGTSKGGAAQPLETPKVKPGQAALPSMYRTANPDPRTVLQRTDRNLATTDIARLARTGNSREVLRSLVHSSPDLSAAMYSYIRAGVSDNYTVVARNIDGSFNREGTTLVNQLTTRFDVLPDYTNGWGGKDSLRSLSESFSKELFIEGALAAELVLDKARLPAFIQPIAVSQIEFQTFKGGVVPVQKFAGQVIDLNIPTFFYMSLDQELAEAYSTPPMEAAIKPTFFAEQFMSDVNRVVQRAGHPRPDIVLDLEAILKNMPASAKHDDEARQVYVQACLSQIQSMFDGLTPEQALVHFDWVKIDLLNNGNSTVDKVYEVIQQMANAKMSTGTKTLPSVLGHGVASSNIASTETLLFMKFVAGTIQGKINDFYSRLFTLAIRLYGVDCYIEFKYAPIDLRPEAELEAFKGLKQSRILDLLSIGFIEDEEAAIQLTGTLPPLGMAKLSGTFFRGGNATTSGDDPSKPSNDGSTLNQKLNPETPTGKRGNPKNSPEKK